MMEKLGQVKIYLELKKMIVEIDIINFGIIYYLEFFNMMFGKKSLIFKMYV